MTHFLPALQGEPRELASRLCNRLPHEFAHRSRPLFGHLRDFCSIENSCYGPRDTQLSQDACPSGKSKGARIIAMLRSLVMICCGWMASPNSSTSTWLVRLMTSMNYWLARARSGTEFSVACYEPWLKTLIGVWSWRPETHLWNSLDRLLSRNGQSPLGLSPNLACD